MARRRGAAHVPPNSRRALEAPDHASVSLPSVGQQNLIAKRVGSFHRVDMGLGMQGFYRAASIDVLRRPCSGRDPERPHHEAPCSRALRSPSVEGILI